MWKTKNFYVLLTAGVFSLLSSCNKNEISWINTADWKKDYKGCEGYRKSLTPVIEVHKNELLDKTDAFFFHTLGKANRVSYSDRGKKIFYYYLSPGSQCEQMSSKTNCLAIEFEALGTSRLIYLEEINL